MTSTEKNGKQIARAPLTYASWRIDPTRVLRLRWYCRRRVNKRENKRLTRQRLTPTMGQDYLGSTSTSPLAHRKGGTRDSTIDGLKSTLERQRLAGTFSLSSSSSLPFVRYEIAGTMRSTAWKFAGWPLEKHRRFCVSSLPPSLLLTGLFWRRWRKRGTPRYHLPLLGWMQTNFLWASHEHLISSGIHNDDWDVTLEQFIWKNRSVDEAREAGQSKRRTQFIIGIDNAFRIHIVYFRYIFVLFAENFKFFFLSYQECYPRNKIDTRCIPLIIEKEKWPHFLPCQNNWYIQVFYVTRLS